jgi:hypothetical protein
MPRLVLGEELTHTCPSWTGKHYHPSVAMCADAATAIWVHCISGACAAPCAFSGPPLLTTTLRCAANADDHLTVAIAASAAMFNCHPAPMARHAGPLHPGLSAGQGSCWGKQPREEAVDVGLETLVCCTLFCTALACQRSAALARCTAPPLEPNASGCPQRPRATGVWCPIWACRAP